MIVLSGDVHCYRSFNIPGRKFRMALVLERVGSHGDLFDIVRGGRLCKVVGASSATAPTIAFVLDFERHRASTFLFFMPAEAPHVVIPTGARISES
jgi:hypothetical protein